MNKCRLFVLLVLAAVVSSIERGPIVIESESDEEIIEELRRLLKYCTQTYSDIAQNKLQEGVLKIIKNWRQGSNSLPIAIQSLPLKFPSASCTYDGYNMTMGNLQINGLENMSVVTLSANESVQSMTFYVVVNVPTVTIQTDWARVKQNGGFFSSFFRDSGILSGQIDSLRATAELQIGLQGSNAVVKNLSLDFSMDNVTVFISEATFGYTNKKLKEKVSKMVRNKDYGFIRNDVIEAIDNYLRGQTPDQLIAKIKAYA